MIGDAYRLKVRMLGNEAGEVGYVFNEYPDFDNPGEKGLQIIFRNGEYDGFSIREQKEFLEFVDTIDEYAGYSFMNVMQVYQDWKHNYWAWE